MHLNLKILKAAARNLSTFVHLEVLRHERHAEEVKVANLSIVGPGHLPIQSSGVADGLARSRRWER
jgi:hypothetical protein